MAASGDPFGLRHDFFRPLWRRVAVTAACVGWGLFELTSGNLFWAILFLALAAYAAWAFFGPEGRAWFETPEQDDTEGQDDE